MADKFIDIVSGVKTLKTPITTSAGAGDAGKLPSLDSTGRLDTSFMPSGVAAETKSAVASEALSAGDMVNLWNDAGTIKARKADASGGATKRANGFVLAGVSSGATATVYLGGINTQRTGLTPGAMYFLSGSTAGAVTTTAPSTATHIIQIIGDALSATELEFVYDAPVTIA